MLIYYKIILCLAIGIIIYKKKVLDLRGSVAALLIGTTMAVLAGLDWLSLLLVFLLLGYLSTRYKYSKKAELRVAENDYGRRNTGNVIANGIIPAFFAVLYANGNLTEPYIVKAAYIAAVATVTGDTLSSEIGVLNKGRPRLITTFEKVPIGTHGGVSLLGELAGVAGALIIGVSAWAVGLADIGVAVTVAVVGGSAGFHFDSFLGAVLERRGVIGNATVNFLSTIVGVIVGLLAIMALA